jgi:desulfoferrodoxin-like iron-binding protein
MSSDLFWKMNTEDGVEDKAVGEKHAPVISIAGGLKPGQPTRIRVNVGGGKHPNANEHHIQWVELRMNGLFVGRVDFSPVIMSPEVEFTVNCPNNPGEISAIARCNLHGLWIATAKCG